MGVFETWDKDTWENRKEIQKQNVLVKKKDLRCNICLNESSQIWALWVIKSPPVLQNKTKAMFELLKTKGITIIKAGGRVVWISYKNLKDYIYLCNLLVFPQQSCLQLQMLLFFFYTLYTFSHISQKIVHIFTFYKYCA